MSCMDVLNISVMSECNNTNLYLTDTRTHDSMGYMKQINSNQITRHLVLIDIENLAGTPNPTSHEISFIKSEFSEVVEGFCDLQCVVACSHRAASEVLFAFPRALRRIRSGPDGADLMLLGELHDHRVMARYDRITLCSGDGIFSDEVAILGRLGVDVTVIAREGSLSVRLQVAARNVVLLPMHGEPVSAALKVAT